MHLKLLVTVLMLLTLSVTSSAGVKSRNRAANNRRHRHRYNPYAVPPTFESYAAEDYEEVEVSSYCRESVAHHENYVREMTQAPNSSSKVKLVPIRFQINTLLTFLLALLTVSEFVCNTRHEPIVYGSSTLASVVAVTSDKLSPCPGCRRRDFVAGNGDNLSTSPATNCRQCGRGFSVNVLVLPTSSTLQFTSLAK